MYVEFQDRGNKTNERYCSISKDVFEISDYLLIKSGPQ